MDKKLRTILDEVKTFLDEDNIFCIYAYGNENNLKKEIIYIPTFSELCFELPTVQEETINLFTDEKIIIRDIRNIFFLDENNIHTAELLYTDNYIVNPKYELIFENLIRPNRDNVIAATRGLRLMYAARLGIEHLNAGETDRARHLYEFCENFKNKKPLEQCMVFVGNTKPVDELRLYFENLLFISTKKSSTQESEDLRAAVMEIIKMSIFKDNSNVQKFIDDLTVGEITALKAVIQSSGEDGLINISKLSEDTGVSRQLFSSLFSKLKTSNYATVRNMGMKGTQIKFLNQDLINKI